MEKTTLQWYTVNLLLIRWGKESIRTISFFSLLEENSQKDWEQSELCFCFLLEQILIGTIVSKHLYSTWRIVMAWKGLMPYCNASPCDEVQNMKWTTSEFVALGEAFEAKSSRRAVGRTSIVQCQDPCTYVRSNLGKNYSRLRCTGPSFWLTQTDCNWNKMREASRFVGLGIARDFSHVTELCWSFSWIWYDFKPIHNIMMVIAIKRKPNMIVKICTFHLQ